MLKIAIQVIFVLPLFMAGDALAAEVELPRTAVPVGASQLLALYGGKTWIWGKGGGYFDIEGRTFRARTFDEGGTESNATGTWRITDNGKLCFEAQWVSGDVSVPNETCFEHMADNGDIYQRRLPDGDWYVFKHAQTEPADEYSKLVRKDLVSAASTTN